MVDVSVIVPVYNGEKYLNQCLDSISNQTLENIEIICINDGSSDNTSSILKKYSSKDNRFKIITTENRGQGCARNSALNEAIGEYISFVDADDWIESDSLELLYKKAKSDDLDMVFFQMVNYMQSSDNFVSTDLYNIKSFENNGINERSVFNHNTTQKFLFEIPVGPVSKFYNRRFIESNNLRFPEGMYFEDNAFFYNAYFHCKKAGFLKKQLYYRRRHEESVTQTFDESKFDIVKAANEVLEVFANHSMYDVYKGDVINHTFSMLLEWFRKSPLNIRQKFYENIKYGFMGFSDLKKDFSENLNWEYKIIFSTVLDNNFYLDFLCDYKLKTTDYVIYNGKNEFLKGSDEYLEYKSALLKKFKISVVIPIYNNERFIHRTLMSIENQSFGIENIEVLMVDDNSNDNTCEVIRQYCDKYEGFTSIHIKEGTGSPGTPRNIGLLESSSDYVIFLDHDDLFEIDALEKLYRTITENDCDFVYGTYASIDIDKPTKIVYPNEKHGYFESLWENKRSIAFPPPSIWTRLFKRDLLIDNNILFPTILGEDAVFVSKVLFNAKGIYYLWDTLVCYHYLNLKSYTKNISYKYLIEGFTSEEYMFNLYNSYDDDFYKIRGEGILDFYMSQFFKSNLSDEEIIKIFPAVYDFTKRLNSLGLTPHVSKENTILYDHILNKDVDAVIKFKKVKPPRNLKRFIKNIVKKILRK
ncbi:glycosyltransferase family 2 protein [uncultured Methanobrevibacter sp.]|uniref:glycosyltransferase family 2 protein n=1 Tax=uncultured Methanobrevibacter sp. TaxID=253161 RepID=UPI0025D933EE|nr:glycosyltransferase family 2 protein [uncultured Methanobrevibacter sp.]